MAASSDFLIVEPPAAGMQRLRARFSGHAYDRHRHETYAVGVTEAGLQCFHYRGAARASTAGRVVVLHPDEAHDGHSGAPGGFAYRMLYADPSLIAAALGGRALPFVAEPVFDDPMLRRVVADAFVDFPKPIEDLAIPALFAALADALTRLAGAPPSCGASPRKPSIWRGISLTSRRARCAPRRWRPRPASTVTRLRAASAPGSAPRRTGT